MITILIRGEEKSSNNGGASEVIDALMKQQSWFVAATGTNIPNQERPIYNSCVTINVTYTQFISRCVYLHYDQEFHTVKIIKVHGLDEANATQIYSLAPVHSWKENDSAIPFNLSVVIKSPFCWNPRTYRIRMNRFIVLQVDPNNLEWLYLIGVHPVKLESGSEYHCAIITTKKILVSDLKEMINKLADYNLKQKIIGRCPRLKIVCALCS